MKDFLKGARLVRVSLVEVRNELCSVFEFGGEDHLSLVTGALIAGPPDEIEERTCLAATVDLGVEDFGDLVLLFAVNLDWRWGCGDTLWNGAGDEGLKHGDVIDGVDAPELRRKTECERLGTDLSDDGIGPEVAIGELARRSSGAERRLPSRRLGHRP